jgi:WD40 repeat protein
MVSQSLPPAPPKHYHFPNDTREPEADESGTGHTNTVWASAFSPDGNYIASCSDDLTIRIWARYKRRDVEGEPGGAFRVGRTEKEGWYCASVLKGYHDRTIFSIDWTDAGNWAPEVADGKTVVLGRLVSTGGDGKICIFGITADHDESERSGFSIQHEVLATVEQAHGVYDVNSVTWCRLGQQSGPQPPLKQAEDDDQDSAMDTEDGVEQKAARQAPMWKNAQNVFATAGDDGMIKVWRLKND